MSESFILNRIATSFGTFEVVERHTGWVVLHNPRWGNFCVMLDADGSSDEASTSAMIAQLIAIRRLEELPA